MRIHYLQHIPFETPGGIETWAVKNGHELSGTPVYKGVPIAPVEMVDWLVVLGGPQNVNDEKNHPWLVAEKRYIADAIERGKAVIGVCLGAQIVANVLGARVTPNRYREIGWHAIELTDAGMSSFGTGSPRELDAFHWHGDTFDLPDGAEHLASSAACTNQMYRVGDRVLGLQCHFEMTREIASKLVSECTQDVDSGPYAQTAEEIMAPVERFDRLNAHMAELLTRLSDVEVSSS